MAKRGTPLWHATGIAHQANDASNDYARLSDKGYGGQANDVYCASMAQIGISLGEFPLPYRVEVMHLASAFMKDMGQSQASIDDVMTAAMVSAQDLEAWRIAQCTPLVSRKKARHRF
jgi:hypothetical protein